MARTRESVNFVCYVLLISLLLIDGVYSIGTFNFNITERRGTNATMYYPQDFIIAMDGNIYVADFGANPPVILMFDKTTLRLLKTFNSSTGTSVETIFQFKNSSSGSPQTGTFLLGTLYGLYQVDESFQQISSIANYTTNFTTGINGDDKYVYVSRMTEKVVLIYDRGNLTTPIKTIGPITYFPPGDLFSPRQIAPDCTGGFWLADGYSGRVFHYSSALSTYPDICLSYNMTSPTGLAMSQKCNFLFVSETQGISRYRAPFTNESKPEGFFDYFQGADPLQADKIQSLRFEDYGNRTGRLYAMIRRESKLISVLTVLPSELALNCDNSGTGTCQIIGDIVADDAVLRFNSTSLTVTGNVLLSNTSEIQLVSGQTITSLGNTSFAGTLTVALNSGLQAGGSQNLTLFNYAGSSGQFASISISSPTTPGTGCKNDAIPSYGTSSLSVLIQSQCVEDRLSSDGDTQRRVIIGVVVGVGGCMIIIIIAGAIGLIIASVWKRDWLRRNMTKNAAVL